MELWQLRQMQSLPLEVKVEKSKQRIKEWYEAFDGQVYVSFSGGKDSTVLLHLVRSMYPEVPAVFIDTGLEYPEIKEFVRTVDNVEWLKPKMGFRQVIEKYGYPVIGKETAQAIYEARRKPDGAQALKFKLGNEHSKKYGARYDLSKWKYLLNSVIPISHMCCSVMKKKPFKQYENGVNKKAIVGTMAAESMLRRTEWLRNGCNSFESNSPQSKPLSFWLEADIWNYIRKFNVSYSNIYDMGYHRTGCMFCMFGCHLEGTPNRFQRMKITHPQLYHYCMKPWSEGGLGLAEVLDYIHVPYGDYVPSLKDYEQMKIEI